MTSLHGTVELNDAMSIVSALEGLKVESIASVEVLVALRTSMAEMTLADGVSRLARDAHSMTFGLDLGSLGRRDAIMDVLFGRHVGQMSTLFFGAILEQRMILVWLGAF